MNALAKHVATAKALAPENPEAKMPVSQAIDSDEREESREPEDEEVSARSKRKVPYTASKEEILLNHQRWGHLNFDQVCKLMGVSPDPSLRRLCQACFRAKMVKHAPPRGPRLERADAPLRWVHIDFVGPIDVPSPAGNRWWLTIVDDFSAMVFVLLLKYKSEGGTKFTAWRRLMENQLQTKVARIYTDADRVFGGNRFQQAAIADGVQS